VQIPTARANDCEWRLWGWFLGFLISLHNQIRRRAMVNALKRFWKDEDGITMIEYSLMAAAVATVSDRGNRASP
jgi:hypothetical protein